MRLRNVVFPWVVVGTLAPAVAPAAPVPVKVVNPASNPAQVRDVDVHARQSFHANLELLLPPDTLGQSGFVPVPEGKRLVIEYASAYGTAPEGQYLTYQIHTRLPGDAAQTHHYLPVSQQEPLIRRTAFIAGHPVKLYAAGHTSVSLRAVRHAGAGTASVRFAISGYLENE